MKSLVILASGSSSRFGGLPKIFASVMGVSNLENIIKHASNIYDRIFLTLNSETLKQYKNKIPSSIAVLNIAGGHGDAYSILDTLEYINKEYKDIKNVSLCWGDAIFVNKIPFIAASSYSKNIGIVSSYDEDPYAWFELNGNKILDSHFKTSYPINNGWHDQSLFQFNVEYCIKYLTLYKEYYKINTEIKEMKLINFVSWLAKNYKEYAEIIPVESKQVYSFNTISELNSFKF